MTDRLHDELDAISSRVRPVDLYERSLRRSIQIGRRRAAAGVGGATLAVLLILVVSWQVLHRPLAAPEPPPATQPPSASPTATPPSPTSPSPTSASPTPQSPTPTEPSPPAPPGWLANATITVPAWPRNGLIGGCGTGPFRLVDGHARLDGQLTVLLYAWTAVSLHGTLAEVVVLSCLGPGEGEVEQVVAYKRTGSGLALAGRVVATDDTEITGFGQLASAKADEVTVEVLRQLTPGTAVPTYITIHQQRSYRLVSSGFVQIAGETTFQAPPAGLSVEASALTFSPPIGGCRFGTMTLTIHNGGIEPALDLTAAVIDQSMELGECDALPVAGEGYDSLLIQVGTLAPGESKTVTVQAVMWGWPGNSVEDSPYNFIYLRTGGRQYPGSTHFVIIYQ